MSLHCVKVLDDDCRARYGRVIVTVKDIIFVVPISWSHVYAIRLYSGYSFFADIYIYIYIYIFGLELRGKLYPNEKAQGCL